MVVIYCYLGIGKDKVLKFHMISAAYFQISTFHFSVSPPYKSFTLKDGNQISKGVVIVTNVICSYYRILFSSYRFFQFTSYFFDLRFFLCVVYNKIILICYTWEEKSFFAFLV